MRPQLKLILILLIAIGIVFRFVNLNHKVFWHDEVYTSLRVAGYTRLEIDQEILQNHIVPARDLQKFQVIKPNSSFFDTLRSLSQEDPQHPPLYFLIARLWTQGLDHSLTQIFGSTLTTARSLPALMSLFALPAMYWLAWELFTSKSVALLATALIAISPFDVLFAQTARQYSLFTVLVIVSQWFLLRSLKTEKPFNWNWSLYALSIVLGLYTQPLFVLTIVAQAVFLLLQTSLNWQKLKHNLIAFGLVITAAIVTYIPWIIVLLINSKLAITTTEWVKASVGIDFLTKLWTLSFTALFFDLDFGSNLTFWLRIPIVVLISLAIYTLCRSGDRIASLSILTSIFVPFLLLVIPDLMLGGQRSAISRYLISCYPGVQLVVAYFLAVKLHQPQRNRLFWQSATAILIAGSLVSLTVSASALTWWNKVPSYFNTEIAQQVNASPNAILVSDRGEMYTNTGDLISLSYLLNPNVNLMLISEDTNWAKTNEFRIQVEGKNIFIFRPTKALKQTLEKTYGRLKTVNSLDELWQLPQIEN